ncbi:MAG: hypothetical protein FJZ56_03125 [Chlamydiae bacterium]|nr:hypothetical protein [Chlamydiota bacterium]
MLQILFLILPLLVAEDSGILDNPGPKPMEEFLDELKTPPKPKSNPTVTYVTVTQQGIVLTLSDSRTFLVHKAYSDIAEGWTLGPEVTVKKTGEFEGFPYRITRVGSTSYVLAREIKPNPQ